MNIQPLVPRAWRATPLLLPLLAVVGCGAELGHETPGGDWVETDEQPLPSDLTYEEFREQSRAFVDGEFDGWIVEQHITIRDEANLEEYYERTFVDPVKKSVGWTIGGQLDARPDPKNTEFCFSGGWSAPIGSFTAPSLATTRTQVLTAMRAWEALLASTGQ